MQSQNKNIFKSFKPFAENFSDIRVVVQGKTYKCHKIILSNVSEYFERLLLTDCEETSSGVINLEDVQSEIFDILYEFIYSAGDETVLTHVSIPSLLELLVCADKWFIPCLTDSCTSALINLKLSKSSQDDLVKTFDKAVTLKNCILTDHVKTILGSSYCKNFNCEELFKVNSATFKVILKQLNLTEIGRFEMLKKWIKNQDFHSPNMQYSLPDVSQAKSNVTQEKNSDSPDVSELLAMINYHIMTTADFKSGPGSSNLITLQSKYMALSAIITRCPYCRMQH